MVVYKWKTYFKVNKHYKIEKNYHSVIYTRIMNKKGRLKMSFTIWLTGIPSSGKTTLAEELKKYIHNLEILDGDILRSSPISKDLGFSDKDRQIQCERVGWLANKFNSHNIPCVVSLVSPLEIQRNAAFNYYTSFSI